MKQYVPFFEEGLCETIRKTGKKTWTIYSQKGRRLGMEHSLPAAKRRLKQIEYFKRLNEGEAYRKFTEEEIRSIADGAGIDLSQYDMNEIVLGMPVELEHGKMSQPDANVTDDDPVMTLQIVLAHLKEIDKYYSEMLIPGEEKFKSVQENILSTEYVLSDDEGGGYYSMDFTSKQPDLSPNVDDAYTYSESEAQQIRDMLKDQFGISVTVKPYAQEYHAVPTFEDYTNDNYRMSDWYFSNAGGAYASDGRAVHDFDFEKTDNQPTQDEIEMMQPYVDLIHGGYTMFDNMTDVHKNNDVIAFGFSAPPVKTGPYAGKDSWWTFVYNIRSKTFALIDDASGRIYQVTDATGLRKLLNEILPEMY